MHRAKHRAAGSDAAVSATTLIERFAVAPAAPSPSAAGRATATLLAPDADDHGSAVDWFGAALLQAAPVEVPLSDEGPLFGAARHARTRVAAHAAPVVPEPRVSGTSPSLRAVRSQPVGTAISATVLGAAAAVTAVVVPAPSAVESTGSMRPVQEAAPAPAPLPAIGQALAAPAAAAGLDQPTVQIPDLVQGVRAQMAKAVPAAAPDALPAAAPYATVASTTALGASPAAMMRRAALTNALGRLGKPYRWGAMGPNAFDCSGLVKWSFANVGRTLPRTSRAMAGVGVPVARRDLQPGDLVFFYQPISHVGIYLGNNKIVHASQTGQPVKVSDITYMRFTAARRIV